MHDFAKGGAWPLLVGEVICLLNCVNERDLCQLLDGRSVVGVWPSRGATPWKVGLVPNYALRR